MTVDQWFRALFWRGEGGVLLFFMPCLLGRWPRVLRKTELCFGRTDFRWSIALSCVAKFDSKLFHLSNDFSPRLVRSIFMSQKLSSLFAVPGFKDNRIYRILPFSSIYSYSSFLSLSNIRGTFLPWEFNPRTHYRGHICASHRRPRLRFWIASDVRRGPRRYLFNPIPSSSLGYTFRPSLVVAFLSFLFSSDCHAPTVTSLTSPILLLSRVSSLEMLSSSHIFSITVPHPLDLTLTTVSKKAWTKSCHWYSVHGGGKITKVVVQ